MTAAELERFRCGDEALFRRLVEEHTPRLLGWVRPRCRDADHARDVVQEVWTKAYSRRGTFDGRGSLLGWLAAICRTTLSDEWRREARQATRPLPRAAEPESGLAAPDEIADRSLVSQAVHSAILELTERQREVVILRLLEGRSTREVAEALGCAEGTAKATLHQALNRLEPILQEWIS